MRAAALALTMFVPSSAWAGMEAPVHRPGLLVEVSPQSVTAGYLLPGRPIPTLVTARFDPAILTTHLGAGAHVVLGMKGPRWLTFTPQVGGVLALRTGVAAGLEGKMSLDFARLHQRSITYLGTNMGGTYLAGEAGGGHVDLMGHLGIVIPIGEHDVWIQAGGGKLWGGEGQGELLFTTQLGFHLAGDALNTPHTALQTP